ncbi:MAG: hypothetical protein LBG17_04120 [Bacteroidales bacterium]|nr:hypothetical protein [Bacteroidales bacterium]
MISAAIPNAPTVVLSANLPLLSAPATHRSAVLYGKAQAVKRKYNKCAKPNH